jgi:hypothetical protein
MPLTNIPKKNIGSARTTCTVLIYRHNRQNLNSKGEDLGTKEGQIDVSDYVTQMSTATNINGGGSASFNIVPAFPWEDEIAASDVVNIYFNTNRKNEADVYTDKKVEEGKDVPDETWKYNNGNVRVFFGFIDQVRKSVTVGGSGVKSTSYSVSCSSFDKAIRATQIYNNPHLMFHGDDGTSVVRADMGNNLGGLILMRKGFPIAGSPRQLIIAHLLRTLGFGGQWLLPLGYTDDLGLKNDLPSFYPWWLQWKKKEGSTSFQAKLEQGKAAKGELVLRNTSFQYYPKANRKNGHRSAGLEQDFLNSFSLIGQDPPLTNFTDLTLIRQTLLQSIKNSSGADKTAYQLYVGLLDDVLIQEDDVVYMHNSYFESPTWNKFRTMLQSKGFTFLAEKGKPLQFISLVDFKKFESELKNKTPTITPLVNQKTIVPSDGVTEATPAFTIFNVLSLDYMEEVDGNYMLSEMYTFSGPLYNQLYRQSNSLIAELFFDLRPAPDFTVRTKDGLGVAMDGAIPMVPAVVFREKPFTNYSIFQPQTPHPTDVKGESAEIKVGSADSFDKRISSFYGDQLFIMVDKIRQARRLVGDTKFRGVVQARLAEMGSPVKLEELAAVVENKPVKNTATPSLTADGKPPEIPDTPKTIVPDGGMADTRQLFKLQANIAMKGGLVDLAERPNSLLFSLPRPIFSSPDNDRITVEDKISSVNAVLGFLEKEGDKVTFKAFGVANQTAGGLTSLPGETVWTNKTNITDVQQAKVGGHAVISSPNTASTTGSGAVDVAYKKGTHHIFDYMTVRDEDVTSESYSRGDIMITNIRELLFSIMPDWQVQKATVAGKLPFVTPISIQRHGVRVSQNNTTDFVQYLLSSGTDDRMWYQTLAMRWAVMLDMWEQHNHEFLAGDIAVRGMPGVRVGYRVDRKELDLSFYVQTVSHTWEYPGALATRITVSRGQPLSNKKTLKYYPPESNISPNNQTRQELGRIFKSTPPSRRHPGTLIGLKQDIDDLKPSKGKGV